MKKIFIVTGEPSGDKLATTVILKLKKINFPLDLVKNFYLYESKRWDIQTNKEILI